MIQIAGLSYQKDEKTTLHIEETTLRRLFLEDAGDKVFGLVNTVSYEWAYRVRWGPEDAEFGIADRSLGHLIYRFGQWAAGGFGAYSRRSDIAQIPVTFDWVREHFPCAGYPWDGSDPDDSEVSSQ